MARVSTRRVIFLCLLVLLQEFGPAHFAAVGGPRPRLEKAEYDDEDDTYPQDGGHEEEEEDADYLENEDDQTTIVPSRRRKRSLIGGILKVVKITSASITGAALTHGIVSAIGGCCFGHTADACTLAKQFDTLKVQVKAQSLVVYDKQLIAKNLASSVRGNVDEYFAMTKKLEDINLLATQVISKLVVGGELVQHILNNVSASIEAQMRKRNATHDQVGFLQAANMYNTALENAMNIGFPLLLFAGPVAIKLYKKLKTKVVGQETGKLERKTGIRFKYPAVSSKLMSRAELDYFRTMKKQSRLKKFKLKVQTMKMRIVNRYPRLKKIGKAIGKGIGGALGAAGAAMGIYSIVMSTRACEAKRDATKDSLNRLKQSKASFDEGLRNITVIEKTLMETFNAVHAGLIKNATLESLKDVQEMLDIMAISDATLAQRSNDVKHFLANIKTEKKPTKLYKLQLKLREALVKIPFDLSCLDTRTSITNAVRLGCAKGQDTFDELYKSQQSINGIKMNKCKSTKYVIIDKNQMKTQLGKELKLEGKYTLCKANNLDTQAEVCEYRDDKDYAPDPSKSEGAQLAEQVETIAFLVDLPEDITKKILLKCPKKVKSRLPAKAMKLLCRGKKKGYSTSRLLRLLRRYKATAEDIKNAKC